MFRKKKQTTPKRNTSPPPAAVVFSYYASRSPGDAVRQPGQPRPNREPKHWWAALPTLIALVIICGSLSYATSLTPQPRVQINAANKALLRDSSFYQAAAGKILGKSLFNRSKLTINTDQVAKQIEASYPELGNVSVILPLLGRRPIIEIQPVEAAMRFTAQNGTFIVDNQGRVLIGQENVASSLKDELPNVIDKTNLDVSVGKSILPLATVGFIQDLTAQLKAKNLSIQSITLPAIANELHLKVSNDSYYVKFDIQGEGRQQIGAYLAAREKLLTTKDLPSEYMDVRIPERVFYK
jgi:hypothetical protein